MSVPEIVIITGMSGAGRTEALHALEDVGFYCIDNLPPNMLVTLSQLMGLPGGASRRLAVVCDLRSRELFNQLRGELDRLKQLGVNYLMVFLDADDDTLRRRYSSLRRRHPLADGNASVRDAIEKERRSLASIRDRAGFVVDTSTMRARDLRALLVAELSEAGSEGGMNVSVYSFGFKYGLPMDADVVIDVRFLPNPYYDPALRDLTGNDPEVRDFVMGSDETQTFLKAWFNLLDVTMPGYVAEGKQHLSVAVGCTGGQHRSVAIAQATSEYLSKLGYRVLTSHRDLSRHTAA